MENESLAQYGTPLQPLDEDNIHVSKARKVSDQVVTDKQGRRRFHGAFTGGFSAGYFNSVGSKEGWTPSTFVSSRSKRVEKSSKSDPTHYMDEEDMNVFGIAVEKLQATADYENQNTNVNKRKTREDWRGPIPGQPVLEELLKPTNMTIGMKLLVKQGWRPGQGIGPRISQREKRRARKEKKTLHRLSFHNDTASSESEDDEELVCGGGFNFAPDDVATVFARGPKVDLFGLGYKPLERGNVLGGRGLTFHSRLDMVDKQKRVAIRGQAFGVGAFEEEDDEIYTKEDMSQYDFTLGGTSSTAQPPGRKTSRWDKQICAIEEGIEGFVLSSESVLGEESYLLPVLPPEFKPWHQPYRRRFQDTKDEIRKGNLSCEERRNIISNPSVEVRSGVKETEGTTTQGGDPHSLESSSFRSTFMEVSGADGAFPPETISSSTKSLADGKDLPGGTSGNITEWQKEREKQETEKSAFHSPLLLAMSSRFHTASDDDGALRGLSEGFNDMKNFDAKGKGTSSDGSSLLPEDTREDVKAAKGKMFGPLTQITCRWVPDKILCKRFNVPHPFPQSSSMGTSGQATKEKGLFSFLSDAPFTPTTADVSSSTTTAADVPGSLSGSAGADESSLPADVPEEARENYGLKVPVSDPPTLDLFKAIFQDSSDSDSEEETPKSNDKTSSVATQVSETSKESTNNQPSKQRVSSSLVSIKEEKPEDDTAAFIAAKSAVSTLPSAFLSPVNAKGVFKGIDFAALNQYRTLTSTNPETKGDEAMETSCSTLPRTSKERRQEAIQRRRRSSSSSTDSSPPPTKHSAKPDRRRSSSDSSEDSGPRTSIVGRGEKSNGRRRRSSGSSVDTEGRNEPEEASFDEEEYGPAPPPHLKGPSNGQPPTSACATPRENLAEQLSKSYFKVRDVALPKGLPVNEKPKKSKKHKHKHKLKHKSKHKHKKKSKKKSSK